MGIHEDALQGTLVGNKLLLYIRNNPNIINELDPVTGRTPLAIAAVAGMVDVVEQLLQRNADANKLSAADETALLLTTLYTTKDRPRIVQLLLPKTRSDFLDATTVAHGKNTPLMCAVMNKDVESTRLIFMAGASLNKTNSNDQKARDLATNAALLLVLDDREEATKAGIARSIIDFLLYIVAFVNKTANGVMREVFGLDPELKADLNEKVNSGETPNKVEFLENIDDYVKGSSGMMEQFFKDKPNFVQDLAKKAADLQKDSTTPLGQEDLLPKTIEVNLRKQVIYYDSSSMKRKELATDERRWDSQVKLVKRIAKITTLVLPKDVGVSLRFINQDVQNSDNLSYQDIEATLGRMRWKDGGDTAIGTYLKSRILQPMVYDKLQSRSFTRPLLITVITDGMPSQEGENTFLEAIRECREKLRQANQPIESVKFLIGQIGTGRAAGAFLQSIGETPDIKESGMVFVTTERLDERFSAFREKYHELDRWLVELLFMPIGKKNERSR